MPMTWRLSEEFQMKLTLVLEDLKAFWKKNWLKGVGFWFLSQACVEYFARHMFTCTLAAAILLGYGSYCSIKKEEQAEREKNEEARWSYSVVGTVAMVFCTLMALLAIMTTPSPLREWLHIKPIP